MFHELPLMYRELLHPLLSSLEQLVITVDWSGCCTPDYHVLRASLLYQGRSIPLYNKVVAESLHEAEGVHESFLHDLNQMVPFGTAVIIVTDGGFRTPWFMKVRVLGWDYIGRVRGHTYCQLLGEAWQDVQGLHGRAAYTPRYPGKGLLGKTSSTQCATCFFAIKQRPHKCKPLYPDAEKRYAFGTIKIRAGALPGVTVAHEMPPVSACYV